MLYIYLLSSFSLSLFNLVTVVRHPMGHSLHVTLFVPMWLLVSQKEKLVLVEREEKNNIQRKRERKKIERRREWGERRRKKIRFDGHIETTPASGKLLTTCDLATHSLLSFSFLSLLSMCEYNTYSYTSFFRETTEKKNEPERKKQRREKKERGREPLTHTIITPHKQVSYLYHQIPSFFSSFFFLFPKRFFH